MASTYSPNLRLELIGTGDQQGTWGITTNTNLGTLLEQAIGGYETVTVSDSGDTTLTANNGSADQSRNMVLNLTGTISAARNVICPAIEKLYVVKNATTGGYAVTFKVNGQTGIAIPNGQTVFLYVDGTDARQITGSLAAQSANNVSITGGSISNATLSNVTASNSTFSNVSVVANASSLGVRDSNGSHVLSIAAGSNLTANRTFTLTTGDAARTLDISAGNVTISTAGAALIDDADAAAQRTTLGLGTIATQNANNVTITGGDISGLSNLSVANATVAATVRTNLGLGTGDSPEFTAVNIGNASDTTVARVSAGVISVEGNHVPSPASQAHGDVLFRGATTWQRLAAGTSGLFLRTAGAGADPTWASAGEMTLLGTLTTNTGSTTYVLGSLNLTSYRALYLQVADTSAGSSSGMNWRFESTTGAQFTVATSNAAQTLSGWAWVDLQFGNFISVSANSTSSNNASVIVTGTAPTGQAVYYGRAPYTTSTTTITISADSGGSNPDAGTIRIYGVS